MTLTNFIRMVFLVSAVQLVLAGSPQYRKCGMDEADPEHQLVSAELTFHFFSGMKSTNKEIVAKEYINSISSVVRNTCKEMLNKTEERQSIYGRHTQVDLMCIEKTDTANASTVWSFTTNGTYKGLYYLRDHSAVEFVPDENWKPCSKNATEHGDRSCYVTVRHVTRDDPPKVITEGILVTFSSSAAISKQKLETGELGTTNNTGIEALIHALESSSFKCDLKNETSNEAGNVTLAYQSTCEFSTEEAEGENKNALKFVGCSCISTTDCELNFYREIYLDVEREQNTYVLFDGPEMVASFWINISYIEMTPKHFNRTEFETSLLSQIIKKVNTGTGWMWTPDQLQLHLIPRNVTSTLAVVVIVQNISISRTRSNEMQLFNKLDQLLSTGTLKLNNGSSNVTLSIPIQNLIRNSFGEEYVAADLDSGGDGVFLWFVGAVVIVIAIVLIVVAIRKQQRESEDSVEPMTFQDDWGMSGGQFHRNDIGGGNMYGISSARSMTTILSDSGEEGSEDDGNLENIIVARGGLGLRSYEHAESPRPIPFAFQVSIASRPVLVTDEDELKRVYYISPPEDANSAFP